MIVFFIYFKITNNRMRSNFQMSHLSPYKSDAFSQSKLENESVMHSSIQSLVRTNRELQDRLNE